MVEAASRKPPIPHFSGNVRHQQVSGQSMGPRWDFGRFNPSSGTLRISNLDTQVSTAGGNETARTLLGSPVRQGGGNSVNWGGTVEIPQLQTQENQFAGGTLKLDPATLQRSYAAIGAHSLESGTGSETLTKTQDILSPTQTEKDISQTQEVVIKNPVFVKSVVLTGEWSDRCRTSSFQWFLHYSH